MDVILYVVDTLRADHLSCYGYDRDTTPNIDAIADDGTRFERCFAPATWTRPVAASIVSGWYPPAHRTEGRRDTLPTEIPVLAEKFSEAGFDTLLVTGMGNVSEATGFDRGFDDCIEVYKNPKVIESRQITTNEREALHHVDKDILAYPRAEDLNAELLSWLEEHDGDTFSLVWAIDPHMPYNPPSDADWYLDTDYGGDPKLGREPGTLSEATTESEFQRLRNLYDCCVRYLDEQIGALISVLERKDRWQDTRFVLVGDHGESFGERSMIRSPVCGHGGAPHDEQIHVPFVFSGVELKAEDRTELVSLVDIPATILGETGVLTGDSMGQGVDLSSECVEREAIYARTSMSENRETYHGVRTKDEKYISIGLPSLRVGSIWETLRRFVGMYLYTDTEQLYELEKDPTEQVNVASERAATYEAYREQVSLWLDTCEKAELGTTGRLDDPQTLDQLEALGYKQ